jgi:phage tail protein X
LNGPQFILHVTRQGERWDTLAWLYYGDPALFGPIIMANPAIPAMPVFDAGISVAVPLIIVSGTQSTAALPPWKT